MTTMYPRAVLAALRGGSGKTTISLGMISAFRRQGRRVVPFKKGPDFIDAGWLSYAAARPCYNLDSFLVGAEQTVRSFFNHAEPGGLSIIEGNRGLFDGMDVQGTHSTAELAKLTQTPVLLIVECTKSTRTVAAMVLGCLTLDPQLTIGGVILNMIGTARQERLIRKAVEEYCGIPVVGAVPKVRDNSLPERHMGLVPPQEHSHADESIAAAEAIVRHSVDLDAVWNIAMGAGQAMPGATERLESTIRCGHSPTIGVIRDSSFWFYYPENLEDLAKLGAKIVEVNSLRDENVPPVDALYIGGGFPETHAAELAGNETFRRSLLGAIAKGLPVYAECGGLMYLGRSLLIGGVEYPMVNAFPVSFTVEERPQGHGYTLLNVDDENPYFPRGTVLKGHEFHYSKPMAVEEENIVTVFRNTRGAGFLHGRDGLVTMNTLATYSHVHSSGGEGWAKALLGRAMAYRETLGASLPILGLEHKGQGGENLARRLGCD